VVESRLAYKGQFFCDCKKSFSFATRVNSLTILTDKPTSDISIIVPNYNNGRYLKAFIQSIIDSTMLPRQLIIVDDGSEDDSHRILQQFSHLPYLEVVYFEQNKGMPLALNAALEISTGKYVMRADPDDMLAPTRIERQFHFMEQHQDVDVVGCNVVYFSNETGKRINVSNFPLTSEKIRKEFLRGEHGVQHPTVFVRGDVYRKYRYQPVFPGEDYELFARMVRDGYRFANIKTPLYFMRIHDTSVTTNLSLENIIDLFNFRDAIFNVKTPESKIRRYFNCMNNYRKFQRSHNFFMKYYYLFMAGCYCPRKVLHRIAGF